MRLFRLNQDSYDSLRLSLESNYEYYLENNKGHFDFLITEENLEDLHIQVDSLPYLKTAKDYDNKTNQYYINYVNSINLYKALEKLPIKYAADPRFWTWLKHTYYFHFINERVHTKGENEVDLNKIKNHYFKHSKSNRDFLVNLWWNAHKTVIKNKNNDEYDFSLTKLAFEYIELFNAVRECLIGRNDRTLKIFLQVLKDYEYNKRKIFKRKRVLLPFRLDFSYIGGVTMLETFSDTELKSFFKEQMDYYIKKELKK